MMMKRNAVKLFRQVGVWTFGICLAWASHFAGAATTAINAATLAPPPGVSDLAGGCDQATPPNCTGNNLSTAELQVWSAAASKSAQPASGTAVLPGTVITYTLSLAVTGAATTSDVVLTDTLSAGLSFGAVTADPGGFVADSSANPLRFTLRAGASVGVHSISYTTRVSASAVGAVSNSVSGEACATPGGCTTTHPVGTVSLTKALVSESGSVPGVAEPGERLGYRLLLSNPTGVAASYDLTDTLGAGLSYESSSPAGVNAGQTTTWSGLAVPANGTLEVLVNATVNAPITADRVRNIAKPTGGPDPACAGPGPGPTSGCIETLTAPRLSVVKALIAESGSKPGIAEAGEMLEYSITLTNTGGTAVSNYELVDALGAGLSYVSSSHGGVNEGQSTHWHQVTVPPAQSLVVKVVAQVNAPITTPMLRNIAKSSADPDPTCPGSLCKETPTDANVGVVKRLTGESGTKPRIAEAGETLTYTITLTNTGGTDFANFRMFENVPEGATLAGVGGASGWSGAVKGPAKVALQVPNVPAGGSAAVTIVFEMAQAIPAGVERLLNLIDGGDVDPHCGTDCAVDIPVDWLGQLSIVKSASVREARVGDLVRYRLTVANIGTTNVANALVIDTPPPGFSYVADSMSVADGDGAFVLGASQSPLQIGGIDVAVGRQATISYLLRVGAGVPKGEHVNQAYAADGSGRPMSNVSTARVSVVGDPLIDESLITGTVFHDRDGDGWQAPAGLSGVRVQGGFDPGAYVAGSTTIDRGQGPVPLPDASAPLLHGVAVGAVAGRRSDADPPDGHQVVIRQRLREPAFTGDFVLTSDQGASVRMDAAGNATLEKSGDAAKGLSGAEPTVERRIARGEDGYLVDYIIRNNGVDEYGIPGVRIASVEGLLIETDQFGRYNLAGVASGNANRGRNFVLKVDPSTLPAGAEFSTANPLVRRMTPGLPARFDFGVKLPVQGFRGATEQMEIELGEVIFAPGSAEIRPEYQPVIDKIAAKVNAYNGGELLVRADGEAQALALQRVQAVEAAVQKLLSPKAARALSVTARTELREPLSAVVGMRKGQILLGTVLFDTDKATVRPRFRPLISQVAAKLGQRGGGTVALVGHADRRASDAYNLDLGLRRANAVYEAIVKELQPELRARVRVEILGDAPAAAGAPGK